MPNEKACTDLFSAGVIRLKKGDRMQTQKIRLSYEDYVTGIQTLKTEEQLSLIEIISAGLKRRLKEKKAIPVSKLAKLRPRRLIKGDPDELVNIKVGEWNEQRNL
jgi:hypothetical protein